MSTVYIATLESFRVDSGNRGIEDFAGLDFQKLAAANVKDLQSAKSLVQAYPMVARALAKQLEPAFLRLYPFSEQLQLIKDICQIDESWNKRGFDFAAEAFSCRLRNQNFDQATSEELLDFALFFVRRSSGFACHLKEFPLQRLGFTARMQLAEEISIKHGTHLAANLDRFTSDELGERNLELLKAVVPLISPGDFNNGFSSPFERWQFKGVNKNERLAFYLWILESDREKGKTIASFLSKLDTTDFTSADFFLLYNSCIDHGFARKVALQREAVHRAKLSVDERCRLYKRLTGTFESNEVFIDKYEQFDLEGIPQDFQVSLLSAALNGDSNLPKLKVQTVSFPEADPALRLLFYKQLVQNHFDANELDKLNLDGIDGMHCLELYRAVALQQSIRPFLLRNRDSNSLAVWELQARNLKLSGTTAEQRYELCLIIACTEYYLDLNDFPKFCREYGLSNEERTLQTQEDVSLQLHKVAILASLIRSAQSLAPADLEAMSASGVIHALFHFANPKVRQHLIDKLPNLGPTPASLHQQWAKLAWIFFGSACARGLSFEKALKYAQLVNKRREFKDTIKLSTLLQLLIDMERECHELFLETLQLVMETLKISRGTKKEQIKEILFSLSSFLAILGTLGPNFLLDYLKLETRPPVSQFLQERLLTTLRLPHTAASLEQTVGQFRNRLALYIYFGSCNNLPDSDQKSKLFEILKLYIDSVVTSSFHQVRYDSQRSVHLQRLFTAAPWCRKPWIEPLENKDINLNDALDSTIDFRAFFKEKIVDHHHLELSRFPNLRNYFEGMECDFTADSDHTVFEKAVINLCVGQIPLELFLTIVARLRLSLGELANDIKSLQQATQAPLPTKGYEVIDSDDPCDLLLMGTEINGSCMRIGGDLGNSMALPSFIMNGEIRLIAIREKGSKRLIARGVLRLLLDEKNLPVLFLEKIYSNFMKPAIFEAIIAHSIEKAKSLKVSLISSHEGRGAPYLKTVHFYGGLAPFIYSDASCRFLITGCLELSGHILWYQGDLY